MSNSANMAISKDLTLSALAPFIWGSTYIVTTELLPAGYPVTTAMLRALPAGLLLLLIVRQLPRGKWILRLVILGLLNFTLFWILLFVSAYRLPGGVAATIGAIQPLIIVFITVPLLKRRLKAHSVITALMGMAGVALLVLTPQAKLDLIGIAAGLLGACFMAFGTVLSRKWKPPVSNLTFTAWQLTAGGLMLVPIALIFEPSLPALSHANLIGFAYLCLIGAAFTYILWFRGIERLAPSIIASLGFLSPVAAVLLGWLILGQNLSSLQWCALALILFAVWLETRLTTNEAKS